MSAATHVQATRRGLLRAVTAALDSGELPVALMMLDIDRLRLINDAMGWETGDAVISALISGISEIVGVDGMVIRIGGDELAVLGRGLADVEAASDLASRVSWRAARGPLVDGRELPLRVSIGLAIATSLELTAAALMEEAGMALSTAKAAGGGRVMHFNDELRRLGRDRFLIYTDLHAAVESEDFVLYYQGQVGLPGLTVVGAEALIRWPHSQRGMISPAVFIPVAEESGLILPLGHWVLQTGARQLARWSASGHHIDVSVNVAAAQLAQPNLVEQVRDVLAETGVDPARLTLEVTESQVMSNLDVALPAMRALHDLGVRFSIDDFGTGYASLTQLKRVPADELKLDQSFIKDLPGGAADRAIVRAAIDMAHAMGMKVVAEGVETAAQLAVLSELNCDIIQGFLLTRPVAADAMQFTVDAPWASQHPSTPPASS